LKTVALTCVLAFAASSAMAQEQGTLWVGTSLMYELPAQGETNMTFSFGMSGILLENSRVGFGPAIDGFWFKEPTLSGLAFMGRLGLASGGAYIAPGVFFVGRQHEQFSMRAGIMFPFGNQEIRRFLPEINVGFRF